MTVSIEFETERKLEINFEKIIQDVIEEAIDYEQFPYEPEVSVIITDNDRIQEINRDMRGIDRPTDVLSFPMAEYQAGGDFDSIDEDDPSLFNPDTGEFLLGDIVISVDKVISQAQEYGHGVERELAFLVAHSMLHLMGYDHMEENERVVMEKKQAEILDRKGYKR